VADKIVRHPNVYTDALSRRRFDHAAPQEDLILGGTSCACCDSEALLSIVISR
jgi:hypothetical protein